MPNNDNEILISLLRKMDSDPTITCPRKVSEPCDGCEFNTNDDKCDTYARKAAHLVANGVIIPPVSLGQTIFILEDIGIQTLPEIVSLNVYRINFTISEDGLDCHIVCVTEIRSIQHIKGEDFGKTVFLTKAEAEQKLKEMRASNG